MNEVNKLALFDTRSALNPKEKQKYLKELFEILSIPSISTLPEHRKDISKAAEWARAHMEKIGLSVKIYPTKYHPLVYGQRLVNPKFKTVLFYGHYDVQPADPIGEWKSDPFKSTIRSGKIFARGATDNKAQFFVHLKAIEALIKADALPVNVKFILEGNEETGSQGISEFVYQNKKLLSADVCVVSDGPMPKKNLPSICYSLRGLVYLQVDLATGKQDTHSGLYGGVIDNPAIVLAHAIAKLKDESGRVLVPGFYGDVKKYSRKELAKFLGMTISPDQIKHETGAAVYPPVRKGSALNAPIAIRLLSPTLEVNGIWSGFTGEGSKTIIPAKASAKISMRLVPFQDPKKIERLFTRYFRAIVRKTAQVTVRTHASAAPYVFEGKQYLPAAEKALRFAFGKTPALHATGGSIGVITDFKRALGVDSLILDIGSPDDNLHAPNEKFDLANLWKGIKMSVRLMQEIGKISGKNG